MQYNIYWNRDYTASEYAFDTTRKSGEVAKAIARGTTGAVVVDPSDFTCQATELIRSLHSAEYADAVVTGEPRYLAESQGFTWDPNIDTMAIAHSTGLVAAVTEVLGGSETRRAANRIAGSLSSGLHHARAGHGAGFCTFNGLVVASEAAFALGAERVLVLDFDAHCGGGTRSMTDPKTVVQLDVSTIGFDSWSPEGDDQLVMARVDEYLSHIIAILAKADELGTFDLVLYNAGMDPATDSRVSDADMGVREGLVAEWAGDRDRRLVYALAGGYTSGGLTMEDLVNLHMLTVAAFG
jgi:acetoin utilization deacetylase AcuC-like enzyme